MKKIIVLLIAISLTTGCQIVRMDNKSIDEIVDNVLNEGVELSNTSLEGYKYYLPKGVSLNTKTESNSILYYKTNKLYLYVDIVSYYHKVYNEYMINDSGYYSRSLDINNKKGYLEINEIEGKYFIEFMYNYAKIEAYVNKEDINKIVLMMSTILESIKYNNTIISTLVGNNVLNYKEEVYDIFESKREDGNFLDYIEKFGTYEDTEGELPDEDNIEIDEETE